MDDAVIAAMAAALAAEEEAGGLPSGWEEGGAARRVQGAYTRGGHADSGSSEGSRSSGCPSPVAAFFRGSVPTKYFVGRG
jgi:hypothetical protein